VCHRIYPRRLCGHQRDGEILFHRRYLEDGVLCGLGRDVLGHVAKEVKDADVTIAERPTPAAQRLQQV
jgi:hypothetical protein